jgi:uncharacterized protein
VRRSHRVFLDANVLFSSAYRSDTVLRQLWSLPATELLASSYAVEEAMRNCSVLQQAALHELLRTVSVVAEAPPNLELPAGTELPADDRPILLAAMAAQASHLLSGDRRAFGMLYGHSRGGVTILRPGEYLTSRGPKRQ